MNRKSRITGMVLVLLAALGAGCVSAQDGTIRERIRERMAERKAGQSEPSSAPSGDIDARITKPGTQTFSFKHGSLTRSYMVHVPKSYDPSKPTPLLVSLHGGGAFMQYQATEENYGQISKSESAGFIVAFPNGYSKLPSGKFATWNAGNCCGPAKEENVDDVGFLRQMVEHLSKQLNVDRSKVFATGISNGGLMAMRLACEATDMFSVIASVAGTDNTRSCNPSKPVRVLMFHAKNDDHIRFNGGMGDKSMRGQVTEFTGVPETVQRWTKRNSCTGEPKRVLEKPGAYCDKYSSCKGDAEVELCVTDSGGHSWPGAAKTRGEPSSKAISANDVMWDFFMEK